MPFEAVSEVVWRMPEWVRREVELDEPRLTDESKMRLAVEMARRNVAHGGGPFGAAIFESGSGEVISVGANWVVSQHCSLLHAEVTAIALAQARLKTHALGLGSYGLFASADPCAQCLGATVWSGVRKIACGAAASDTEAIGFDEGPRRDDWVAQLEVRGIRVVCGLLADEAIGVLKLYSARGGPIYNAFSSGP